MDNKSNQMTKDDAARIQSANVSNLQGDAQPERKHLLTSDLTQAKNDGDMSSSGFPARAQAAGDKNANAANANTTGASVKTGGSGQVGGSGQASDNKSGSGGAKN